MSAGRLRLPRLGTKTPEVIIIILQNGASGAKYRCVFLRKQSRA